MRTKARSQAFWAEQLFAALHAAGIREVVLSPGSRSTPFVMAALAHPGLRVHDIVDERVAGFFALGIGRATGRPAVLLCTSGTAAAHYYPAVVEAGAAFIPLIVLTADRPIDLHGCGANQAVDQTRFFGTHARSFVELGAPCEEERAIRAMRRAVVQAVHASRASSPGAVQLNARAEKPLEPPLSITAEERAEDEALRVKLGSVPTLHAPRLSAPIEAIDALESLVRAGRGVILAGPAHPTDAAYRESVFRAARRAGLPVFAEAGSQLRYGPSPDACVVGAVDALLRASWMRDELAPDFVIQLGAPPVTRGGLSLLERHRGALAVIAEDGFPDPESRAAHVISAPVTQVMDALFERLETAEPPDREAWVRAHREADSLVWSIASSVLESSGEELTEAATAREVVASLPPDARLALGNSLPIRQVEAWAPPRAAPLRVLTQRGASGIDGLVSAAAGAVAATREPLTLLLGDLSFLHDASGLAAAAHATAPLTVVVVNNGGGRIFEQLPVGAFPEETLRHFVTPLAVRIEDLCRAYGVGYARASTRTALRDALARSGGAPGCTVIEAIVPPRGAAPMQRSLFDAVEARLGTKPDEANR
ncbi:MAG: 2-succinyl-5-enolpyruvyl-6-hydroxy-3-cyclohexene-1-carboxylic-acid synthase [Polyangiaceae bacterium]|nr:2-succinyl-5-enolpyruvyl-6-hydroxy-3-cyclohexene-1-carboxylic-acid synthase [Polyangiaceae bacterium]